MNCGVKIIDLARFLVYRSWLLDKPSSKINQSWSISIQPSHQTCSQGGGNKQYHKSRDPAILNIWKIKWRKCRNRCVH